MRVEPVSFGVEHKALLYHAKFMLENKYIQIHPTMDKLITALRSSAAPGQEAKSPGDAQNLAPGQGAKLSAPTCQECDAKDFAPGQEKQITK